LIFDDYLHFFAIFLFSQSHWVKKEARRPAMRFFLALHRRKNRLKSEKYNQMSAESRMYYKNTSVFIKFEIQ